MATVQQLEEFFAEPRNAIVIGVRRDGTPQATPNWFSFDGGKFYVSTTRKRAKYHVFKRDPRVVLLIDDAESRRYVQVAGTVAIHEDVRPVLPIFRKTRIKHSVPVPEDEEFIASLEADERVLLEITPEGDPESWRANGFN
jgi:PPOX class probable F420-dependent enzyme